VLPPIGIYLTIIFLILNLEGYQELERAIQSVTTFFMWLKLLYFMRIFKNTGYLIRMIVVVITDMGSFLLVLLIGLVAFGDSFLSIAHGNADIGAVVFTTGFVDSIIYVYNIILGGFDTSEYEGSINYILVMILFLLCTIFNMIVMLNLLIAIISESFANVNSNAKNATFQEMASLIAENNYLIPSYRKSSYATKNQHLMVITDLDTVESDFSDPVLGAIEDSKTELMEEIKQIQEEFEEVRESHNKGIKDAMDTIGGFKTQLQGLYKMVHGHFKEKKDGDDGSDMGSDYEY